MSIRSLFESWRKVPKLGNFLKELFRGSGVIGHDRGTGSPRLTDTLAPEFDLSSFGVSGFDPRCGPNRASDKDGVGMSRSQVVAEHLPLLRRYARALTGNQASGDAYVGAMLEALLQDGALLDEKHGPRAGLFRLFTQIWNSVGVNDNPDVATLALPSERRLSDITPLPRQAFLLLSLEGFSEEEVAFILGADVAETRRLADAAGRGIGGQDAAHMSLRVGVNSLNRAPERPGRKFGQKTVGGGRLPS